MPNATTDVFRRCNLRIVEILKAFEADGVRNTTSPEFIDAVRALHLIGGRSIMLDPNGPLVQEALGQVDKLFEDLFDEVNASPTLRETVKLIIEEAKA